MGLGLEATWVQADSTSMSSEMPCGASVSGASGPPGLAATGIIGAPRNLEGKYKPPMITEPISTDSECLWYNRQGTENDRHPFYGTWEDNAVFLPLPLGT